MLSFIKRLNARHQKRTEIYLRVIDIFREVSVDDSAFMRSVYRQFYTMRPRAGLGMLQDQQACFTLLSEKHRQAVGQMNWLDWVIYGRQTQQQMKIIRHHAKPFSRIIDRHITDLTPLELV